MLLSRLLIYCSYSSHKIGKKKLLLATLDRLLSSHHLEMIGGYMQHTEFYGYHPHNHSRIGGVLQISANSRTQHTVAEVEVSTCPYVNPLFQL